MARLIIAFDFLTADGKARKVWADCTWDWNWKLKQTISLL